MARDTKPNLTNDKFEQFSGETLTLSGTTEVHGIFEVENGGTFKLDDGNQQEEAILTSNVNGIASWRPNTFPFGLEGNVYFINEDNTRQTDADFIVKDAIVVETDEELSTAQGNVVTFEEIFNTWTLFSHMYLNSVSLDTRYIGNSSSRSPESVTGNGTEVTIILEKHGMVTGSKITVTGANESEYNVGNYVDGTIANDTTVTITVIDRDTFTYTTTSTVTTSSPTGTILIHEYYDTYENCPTQTPRRYPAADPLNLYSPFTVDDILNNDNIWYYDDINDRIYCSANFNAYTGFISKDSYDYYELTVDATSGDSDDDIAGIILAFVTDEETGFEYTISLARSYVSGAEYGFTYAIVYNHHQNGTFRDTYDPEYSDEAEKILVNGSSLVTTSGSDWNIAGGTKMYAKRDGDIITVKISQQGGASIDDTTELTYDLKNDVLTDKFRGPAQIGFGSRSQADLSFSNLQFSRFGNYIFYNKDTYHDTYEYDTDTSTWFLQNPQTLTLHEYVGVGRIINSKTFSKIYYTNHDNTIDKLAAGGSSTGSTSITTSNSLQKPIAQASHGFTVGDFIGWSGGSYNKAIADGEYNGEYIGLVTNVPDVDNFYVAQAGYVTGLTSLSASTTYFLSDSTAGLITPTEPNTDGSVSKAILIADSSTSGWVLPYPGYIISSGSTSTSNSEYLYRTVTQTAHGFDNDFIYYSGTSWTKAIADGDGSNAATHFSKQLTADTFELIPVGEVNVFSMTDENDNPLSVGEYYFLSQTVAGKVTAIKPTSGITQSVLKVNSTTYISVSIQEPYDINDTGGSGEGASTFLELNDTPSSYIADNWIKVNSSGTALELTTAPSGGTGGVVMNGDSVNGLTTYVDSSTICAQSGITYDNSTKQFTVGSFIVNDSPANSMFIGSDAGLNATGSTDSNFMGYWAGRDACNSSYSNFLGFYAGHSACNSIRSNFIGRTAGYDACNSSASNFIGYNVGSNAVNSSSSNFIGNQAGWNADNSSTSNFIGFYAGYSATGSTDSNFLGNQAGSNACDSTGSNFMGCNAGYFACNSSYSNFIGRTAGDSACNSSASNFIGCYAGYYACNSSSSNFLGNCAGYSACNSSTSNFLGFYAGHSATGSTSSNFLGNNAGFRACNSSSSNFMGHCAGYQATGSTHSNFLGISAGRDACNNSCSNFLGNSAGSYADNSSTSNFIGYNVGSNAVNSSSSNFIGNQAGWNADNSSTSNFIGFYAGYSAMGSTDSNFLGNQAGRNTCDSTGSNFIGNAAGNRACNSSTSNFIGFYAGSNATGSTDSNFLGNQAGRNTCDSSCSNLIGYNVGSSFTGNNIGSNNTIIGTNISLPSGCTNMINLGGVLFGTNTYSTTTGDPSIIPQASAQIGIGMIPTTDTFEVSGNTTINGDLHLPHITGCTNSNVLYYNSTDGSVSYGAAGGGSSTEVIQFAVSDETTDLTTGTAKITFRMPYAMTLTEVRASVGTAPTGANLIVDINENGTSVLSTKLSIDAGEKTSTTAATAAVISDSNLADDAEITVDIDQIGSTVAGAGLKITLKGTI